MKKTGIIILSMSVAFSVTQLLSYNLIRLGSNYGGWTIPDNLLDAESVVYCGGAGEDISFDVGLVRQFDCEVYIFDPTPRAARHIERLKQNIKAQRPFYTNPDHQKYVINMEQYNKLHFRSVGLWNEDAVLKFFVPRNPLHVSHSVLNLQKTDSYFEAPCKKLVTIMAELGHSHIDLLKLDIEGAEYAVLESIIKDGIEVRCICLEFDELAGINKACNEDIAGTIEKIKGYIHLLEQNGYVLIYSKGYIDMTFLKQSD